MTFSALQKLRASELNAATQTYHLLAQLPIVYTAASTAFTKASYTGLVLVHFKIQADGGGSGGCASTNGSQIAISAPGGGGEYCEGFILASDLASSETITVGQGGAAGTAGDNSGGTGGGSSLGAHATCIGGSGGTGGSVTATGGAGNNVETGGLGGTGGTFASTVQTFGRIRVNGGDGSNSQILNSVILREGRAGDSVLGRGRRFSTSNDIVGATGYDYGTGGSPTISPINKAAQAGALGGKGLVELWLYGGNV